MSKKNKEKEYFLCNCRMKMGKLWPSNKYTLLYLIKSIIIYLMKFMMFIISMGRDRAESLLSKKKTLFTKVIN